MTNRINLSMPEHKLAQLIRDGHLCAADFSCLDSDSKKKVWQLCLLCCKNHILCGQCTHANHPQIDIYFDVDVIADK